MMYIHAPMPNASSTYHVSSQEDLVCCDSYILNADPNFSCFREVDLYPLCVVGRTLILLIYEVDRYATLFVPLKSSYALETLFLF